MQEELQAFLEHLKVERGSSPHTVAAYKNDLNQFLSYLQMLGPAQRPRGWGNVTRDQIVSYILEMRDREYASSTIARKIAAVKSFFGHLHERGLLRRDPSAELDSPKVEKHLPSPMTHAEVDRLLAIPKPKTTTGLRDLAILEMLYATGLRVSELVGLNVADVDLAAGSVRCLGKGNKERVLPILERALEVIRQYAHGARPDLARAANSETAFFLNRRGERLTRQGLWLIIKHYVEEAGIEAHVTPHTLRHSFATHMLRGGAGLRELQHLLGHADISTTQVYTQVTRDHLREVYDEAHPRA